MHRSRLLFSTITASLVLAGTAAAQKKTETHFGVLGGVTFAKLGGKDVPTTANVKNRVGFAGGVFATIGVAKNVALEPEALFAIKGAKETEGTVSANVRLTYLDVPLFLKLSFPSAKGTVSPHLYAGPQIGFKLSCHVSGTDGTTAKSGKCEDPDLLDFKTKSSDFSLVFGGGVDVGRAIIDARYDLGFSKVPDQATENNIKNRTIYLLVGWTFGPGH